MGMKRTVPNTDEEGAWFTVGRRNPYGPVPDIGEVHLAKGKDHKDSAAPHLPPQNLIAEINAAQERAVAERAAEAGKDKEAQGRGGSVSHRGSAGMGVGMRENDNLSESDDVDTFGEY